MAVKILLVSTEFNVIWLIINCIIRSKDLPTVGGIGQGYGQMIVNVRKGCPRTTETDLLGDRQV